MGYCSRFGNQNLVTGNVEYEDALDCRKNSSKFGENGVHYYPK